VGILLRGEKSEKGKGRKVKGKEEDDERSEAMEGTPQI